MEQSDDSELQAFGSWRYQPQLRTLVGPDGEVRLKPLLDRLLRRLLADPGKVLSRDQLLEEVWTRKQVNDEVLSRAIAELRGLLGDDARKPRYIETLAKGGYRWIASPEPLADITRSPPHQYRRAALSLALVTAALVMAGALWWTKSQRPTSVASSTSAELDAQGLLQARPLTAHLQLELDPRFDSSGRVVYVRADPTTNRTELVMTDPGDDAERVLWAQPGLLRHPTASPDGREVAVMRRSQAAVERRCELIAVSVLDAQIQHLADCDVDAWGSMEWTADGQSLLYTGIAADSAHAPGLNLLDRQSLRSRAQTTPLIAEGAHLHPRLSPDQRYLVYASQHGGDRQLWWTDWPEMRRHRPLLGRPEPIYGHSFTPDGSALWVAGDLLGYRALNRLTAAGEITLLGGRGAQSIDLLADGSAVWTLANYDADVWVGPAESAAEWRAVGQSTRYESQPAFSPDGQQLAMITNRGGTEAIQIVDLRNDEVRQLPLDRSIRWVRPNWSADGGSLILSGYRGSRTDLYRYDLGQQRLHPISGLPINAFAGVALADRLLFLSGESEQRLLQQRIGENGAPKALPLGAVRAFRANSRWLAWVGSDEEKIRVAPIDRWEQGQVVATSDPARIEALALGKDALYFVADDVLWRQPLPDGPRQALEQAPRPTGQGPSVALSSDGKLAIGRLNEVSMDLMIARPSAKR